MAEPSVHATLDIDMVVGRPGLLDDRELVATITKMGAQAAGQRRLVAGSGNGDDPTNRTPPQSTDVGQLWANNGVRDRRLRSSLFGRPNLALSRVNSAGPC